MVLNLDRVNESRRQESTSLNKGSVTSPRVFNVTLSVIYISDAVFDPLETSPTDSKRDCRLQMFCQP